MSIITILLYAGALQAFLLGTLLVARNGNRSANIWLALHLFALAVEFLLFNVLPRLYTQYPFLLGIRLLTGFLYGPLQYLYIRSLLAKHGSFRPGDIFHFLPFFLVLASLLPFFFYSPAEKLEAVKAGNYYAPATGVILDELPMIMGAVYMLICLRLLNIRQRSYKKSDGVTAWARVFTYSLSIIWLLAFASNITGLLDLSPGLNPDLILYAAIAVLVYSASYKIVVRPSLFVRSSINDDPRVHSAAAGTVGRYRQSGLTPEASLEILGRLKEYMEKEKPYLQSELSLSDIASALNISRNHLSQVLNEQLGQNFYSFINQHRVDEAKRQIMNRENEALTLLAIAYNSGFNSKTSFNTVFKQVTGTTPSGFRKQYYKS